ncbi:MAG: S8 family serine peptidase [Alcanivoracaceae bacterium]|nr:S8 family serine peptidase [Alcanivoracaceae bacterium]
MLKFNKLALSVITVLSTATVSAAPLTSSTTSLDKQMVQMNPLAPGIIIKYKNTNKSQSVKQSMRRAEDLGDIYGIDLKFKRMMSGGAEVLSLTLDQAKSLSSTDIQDIINQLNKRADIEFAEVDALVVPYLTPNDTAYNTQWHYFENAGGMRLPAAWDTTTGSSAVTVAVLDTGYRPHADLAGNVVGQYDMISSAAVAGDGGGRDSNAQDPGDFTAAGECGAGSEASNSSWHGTHVAGTVAAVSNNNNDVTGVAWGVNLVPVRVLGRCGGSLSDIADGIRWASGLSVSGVPANANPAQVINMSLGSGSPAACSSTYQNAVNAAVSADVTVVVAAGNSNSSSGFPPANCNNVVSVAATNRNGARAYYSNFGSAIDVAAPGGDGCQPTGEAAPTALSDCEGGVWSEANMIQSTHNTGTSTPGSDNIGALQGTSMAAPHVAGLAALMYSVKPATTPAEVESVLKSTARAFPNVSSHQCTTANCGAGIVDANAAVLAMGGGTPPTNELENGVAVTGLSGAKDSQQNFTLAVPSEAINLTFNMSGGTGDADLYVKFGSAPTLTSYDCRPFIGGNTENCPVTTAQTGTYHVMIVAYSAYTGVSLTGSYSIAVPNVAPTASFTSSCTDLTCSFNASGSSDSDGSISNYSWSFGGSGVTASNTFANAGTFSVTLTVTDDDGATDTSTQSVTVTAPSGGGSFFENTSNVTIPDNNPTGATSNLNVTRTGASGSIKVTYSIVHTYIGDLKVEIFTPTGQTAVLRDGAGGSANNINESKNLNAGTIEASGNWRLKVTDDAGADTGFIDSWSVEFL